MAVPNIARTHRGACNQGMPCRKTTGAVRGSRSFGVQQSGVRRQRGSRKSAPVMHAWSMTDTQVMERMANANYRGGKLERKTHAFRNAASQMKSSRAVLAANLTAGLE